MAGAAWTPVLQVGGTERDTLLYYPAFLAADTTGPYVYDSGRYAVLHLSTEGHLLWSYGRRGKGPDGFTNVRDVKMDSRGRLWVLDPGNTRITVLTREGQAESRIPLRDVSYADQVIPLPTGEAILVVYEREGPLAVVNVQGRVLRRLEVPWPGFRQLDPLAAQMIASEARSGGLFAVAFRLGNGFFLFRHSRPLPYHGVFVEHTNFPSVTRYSSGGTHTARVSPSPQSALSIVLRGDYLYVHFAGTTENRYALIDIYEVQTGRYVRSLVLPRPVTRVAVDERGVVYGVVEEPYPTLYAWKSEQMSAPNLNSEERSDERTKS